MREACPDSVGTCGVVAAGRRVRSAAWVYEGAQMADYELALGELWSLWCTGPRPTPLSGPHVHPSSRRSPCPL